MDFARIKVFKLGGTGLSNFDVGNQREDDICRVTLLYMGLNSEGICGVDEDTGVLGGDD